MVNVPVEYLGFDYGFSAVDESEMLAKKQVIVTEAPVVDMTALESKFDNLNDKLDRLLIAVNSVEDNIATDATDQEIRDKIRQLEAIVVPLLNNLLKTADKEWIHWPNRREVCQKQLDRVLSITRG